MTYHAHVSRDGYKIRRRLSDHASKLEWYSSRGTVSAVNIVLFWQVHVGVAVTVSGLKSSKLRCKPPSMCMYVLTGIQIRVV